MGEPESRTVFYLPWALLWRGRPWPSLARRPGCWPALWLLPIGVLAASRHDALTPEPKPRAARWWWPICSTGIVFAAIYSVACCSTPDPRLDGCMVLIVGSGIASLRCAPAPHPTPPRKNTDTPSGMRTAQNTFFAFTRACPPHADVRLQELPPMTYTTLIAATELQEPDRQRPAADGV